MHEIVSRFWIVFLFLFVFSLYTFFAVIKLNFEFENHLAAIQWASEQLRLNKSVSKNGKYEYQGYMALPLSLGFSRRAVFRLFTALLVASTIAASLAGGILDRSRDLMAWICGPCAPQPGTIKWMAYAVAVISLVSALILLLQYAKHQEDNVKKIIENRRPNRNRVGSCLAQLLGSPQNQAIIGIGVLASVVWTLLRRLG